MTTVDDALTGANAYQSHSLADTFLRYTQNDVLLKTLANIVVKTKPTKLLDIGFSGRYSSLFCGIPEVHILNNSNTQLNIGEELFFNLCRAYQEVLSTDNYRNLKRHLTWLEELDPDDAKSIQDNIISQFKIMTDAGIKPSGSRTVKSINALFDTKNPYMENNSYEMITFIDIFPHISSVNEVMKELYRVTKKGGYTVMTFFQFSEKISIETDIKTVDSLFENLISLHEIFGLQIYDNNQHCVFPSKLNAFLKENIDIDLIARRLWLDLDVFYLQSVDQMITAAKEANFTVIDLIDTPGGMFNASRKTIVASK